MIVSLHVATGAAAGALAGSRAGAVVIGPVAHLLGDLTPHEDISSTTFEAVSGGAVLLLVARRHGVLAPATLGALAASAPDVEHLLQRRLGGRKLFPSHRFSGWHRRGGLPAWAQLALAAAILAVVVRSTQTHYGHSLRPRSRRGSCR
ncbi:MAG: hypothetical protein ABR583_04315, partial [Gaiellaceae bacterium]